jgi:hypothetical protein
MQRPETTISGRVVAITPEKRVGSKQTPLRTVVIDWGDKYPSPTPIEVYGAEGCAQLGNVAVGDNLTVDCYVTGRAWNDRYFATVRAVTIICDDPAMVGVTEPQAPMTPTAREPLPESPTSAADDLPF